MPRRHRHLDGIRHAPRLRVTKTATPPQSPSPASARAAPPALARRRQRHAASCMLDKAHAQCSSPPSTRSIPTIDPRTAIGRRVRRAGSSRKRARSARRTRSRTLVGYGLPHWIWTGIDVNAIITTSVLEVYGGRAHHLHAGVRRRVRIRDNWSFDKPFLNPKSSYTYDDVFNQAGPAGALHRARRRSGGRVAAAVLRAGVRLRDGRRARHKPATNICTKRAIG